MLIAPLVGRAEGGDIGQYDGLLGGLPICSN